MQACYYVLYILTTDVMLIMIVTKSRPVGSFINNVAEPKIVANYFKVSLTSSLVVFFVSNAEPKLNVLA